MSELNLVGAGNLPRLVIKKGDREFSLVEDGELIIFTDTPDGKHHRDFRLPVRTGESLLEELAEFLGYQVIKKPTEDDLPEDAGILCQDEGCPQHGTAHVCFTRVGSSS